MDIEKQLTNNIQEILSNTSPSVYYYLLVDSTFFNGVEKFTCTTKFLNQTYKNLYEDFSENLKNNGALLFQFNNDDIKNYYDDLQGIIEVGAFNFIVSDFDFENLSDHLEDLMEVIQPNGKSALFRFQDNFALDATLTSIDLKNFQKILSYKIKNWIWQSPDNKIYKVKNTVNYLKKISL
ncbi:DUF4123 domain-containing protein [Acinetobacter indicus]|nr:DUF4123 domain-containing protein [Acinetobacter indicus]